MLSISLQGVLFILKYMEEAGLVEDKRRPKNLSTANKLKVRWEKRLRYA